MVTHESAKRKLLVLVGPTAVGKTRLSLEIAESFGCEIISGDSMQVYRGMDIGTAKATKDERSRILHHMIDIHDPDYPFSVAEFQDRSRTLIEQISERGRLPFIVGGTGLYIESLCYGFQFSDAGSDEAFREEQLAYLKSKGEQALHDKLRQIDPPTAERLHPNDHRRVIRALEVAHLTGIPMSQHLAGQRKESPYDLCLIGLTMDRQLLYKRIEDRIDQMVEEGLVEEVKGLRLLGYGDDLVSMQGLGYKEITAYLRGELSWEDAIVLLKRNTRRFAKRQLSWFRHMKDIRWVDVSETSNFSKHLLTINDIIAGKLISPTEYTS
ncbi:tRNA (adenosine(37)-N6)-dimethylallyltransferase MiaA [Paenibacillus sp. J2TS4]|uniref:tRNA (adenosine(37)-N6)-dimethylallyltransferase MiaA n=1 Tax=Paenibacillus sp. J2TS4 TaxID=2807194 RepID=UPI001B0B804D|nr:tRNA (adenosine(37)-N6)-dimethylallyltransferase MiaA [Paenibacillus sp. J2TS4]GIP32578.1 tRNA dimethylallyltransferase [Paenibacillus sp. J2TS4]